MIEVALVLIIVSLALGGILVPLNAQIQQRRLTETTQMLNEVNDALLGFAISNNRLPCPAAGTDNGMESFTGSGVNIVCTLYDGYVPAKTLGLGHIDTNGFLIDAWGNRVRYAISNFNPYLIVNTSQPPPPPQPVVVFVAQDGINIAKQNKTYLASGMAVCISSTGIDTNGCGSKTNALTSDDENAPPVVIYSLGPDGANVPTSADETANLNKDKFFVSHTPTPAGSTQGQFDDLVIWMSPNLLYNAMNNAGLILPAP